MTASEEVRGPACAARERGRGRLAPTHTRGRLADIDGLGFPDTGSGRLSALLSDEDWFRFNSVERCHLNYLETLPLYLSSILLGGLYFPIPVAVCAGCIIVGRTMFSCGYVRKGAPGRTIGFVLATLAAFTAFGFTVYGAIGQLGSG